MPEFRSEIIAFVRDLITRKMKKMDLDDVSVDEGSKIIGPGGFFDSMQFFELILQVENEFNIEVDLSDFEPSEFSSLGGFARCVAVER